MNTPSNRNPYQPPKADVTPPGQSPDEEFIEGGQSVTTGSALSWIGSGWTLFLKSPGIWILNMIILFVISIALSLIPGIGGFVSTLLTPIFIGGLMLGCRSLDAGEGFEVNHLFAGFKERGGQLALVGLLMLVGVVVIVIAALVVVIVMFGSSIMQSFSNQQALTEILGRQGLLMLALVVLIIFALSVPVAMAYWFAPALVVFHNLDAVNAMKQSFQGCLRNLLPFLLYGIVFLALSIVAVIPIGLGLLVLFPMVYGSLY